MLGRLTELMFVEILREYMQQLPQAAFNRALKPAAGLSVTLAESWSTAVVTLVVPPG